MRSGWGSPKNAANPNNTLDSPVYFLLRPNTFGSWVTALDRFRCINRFQNPFCYSMNAIAHVKIIQVYSLFSW